MNWTDFEQALLEYDKELVESIYSENSRANSDIYFVDAFIVKALQSIGEKWENGEASLAQVYMSSKLCETISIKMFNEKNLSLKSHCSIGILTLEDYHTLGKKIVSSVIRSEGYLLEDFGTMNSLNSIVDRIKSYNIDILVISVLMYPSAIKIRKLTNTLHEMFPNIKILVGGAPFLMDKTLWVTVGADAMGRSASDSVSIIKHWIEEVDHVKNDDLYGKSFNNNVHERT